MATKEEMANEAKVAELKQLAADNDVDLEGATTKKDIVEKITASRKVTKDDLDRIVGDDDDSDDGAGPEGPTTAVGVGTSDSRSGVQATTGSQTGIMSADEAADRVKGTTSDAATRDADERAADVEPDQNFAVHQSDAGEEQYPFPPAGDVEIATVPTKKYKGETIPPLEIEDWVVLGKNKDVPDELVGATAAIVGRTLTDEDEVYRVRTRDEHGATLLLERDAFADVIRGGRGLRVN